MATLRGRNPKNTVQELLKINASGLTGTLATVESGDGTATPLQLSTTAIALNGVQWPTTGASAGSVLTVSSNGTSLEWAAGGSTSWDTLTDKPAVIAAGSTAADAREAIEIPETEYFSIVYAASTTLAAQAVTLYTTNPDGFGATALWNPGQLILATTGANAGALYIINGDGTKSEYVPRLQSQNGSGDFDRVLTSASRDSYIFRVRQGAVVQAPTITFSRSASAILHDGGTVSGILGLKGDLTTTVKTNLVSAINEVNANKVSSGSIPYDIATPVFGKPAASEVVLRVRTQRAFTLDTFYGYATTTATASSAVFTVAKNGSSIGNITFAVSTNASTTTVATTSFAVGDILTITAPSSQNASLADIDFFLKGTA